MGAGVVTIGAFGFVILVLMIDRTLARRRGITNPGRPVSRRVLIAATSIYGVVALICLLLLVADPDAVVFIALVEATIFWALVLKQHLATR